MERAAPSGFRTFQIRGMQNGSYGVCSKPKTSYKDDTLFVEIPKVMVKKGLKTGPYFDVKVTAPNTVKQISFGTKKEEVWPHDSHKKDLLAEEAVAESLAQHDFLARYQKSNIDDYTIEVKQSERPSVFLVKFLEWMDGKPSIEYSYLVDTFKKTILSHKKKE